MIRGRETVFVYCLSEQQHPTVALLGQSDLSTEYFRPENRDVYNKTTDRLCEWNLTFRFQKDGASGGAQFKLEDVPTQM